MAPSKICESPDGDGCGGVFPNKTSTGTCAKCQKLASFDENSSDFRAWQLYGQCKGCGIAWKHFKGGYCGACSEVLDTRSGSRLPPPPSTDIANKVIDNARRARTEALGARLGKNRDTDGRLDSTNGLNYLKNGGGAPGSEKIMVSIEVTVKGGSRRDALNADPGFGKWARAWARDVFLSEILDDSLKTVNVTWEKTEVMSLIRDEVEFRMTGNKIFLPGTANLTIGEAYNRYMTGDAALFYAPSSSSRSKATKAITFHLELNIDKKAFLARQEAVSGVSTVNAKRKYRGVDNPPKTNLDAQQSKRPRKLAGPGITILPSTFINNAATRHNSGKESWAQVSLVKAQCICEPTTGEIEITWPPDDAQPLSGMIANEVFASGLTKNTYKLSFDNSLFVAKRFFETGLGAITAQINQNFLEAELTRLKQGAWFLGLFNELAQRLGADISHDFKFSDGFLVREIGIPSPAAALPCNDNDDAAIWLVEPRRTKSVMKFSGTMIHPTRDDKIGATITAFAHFSYQRSGKTLVFADIQGSPMAMGDRDGVVLFDLMTHSPDGDSGVGDHGNDGIKIFQEQHKCSYICQALGLEPLNAEVRTQHHYEHGDDEDFESLDEV